MNKKELRKADIAQHRVDLKRTLRLAGCPFDNDDTTERLTILVKFVSE